MLAAGGVRGTDHAAHFGGVFAGKGSACLAEPCVVSLLRTWRGSTSYGFVGGVEECIISYPVRFIVAEL